MAAFTALSPVEKVLLTFSEFQTATTKDVDFDSTIGGNLEWEARDLLRTATQQRELLAQGLTYEGSKVDPRNVVKGVESYQHTIWKITHSMEASSSANIILRQPLIFSWTSALAAKSKPSDHQVLVYEVACVLTCKALAHHNIAKNLITSDVNHAEAAKELKIGAGILDYVGKTLLPKWVSPPEKRPPEVQIPVVNCLSLMFQGMAQRIAIAKAMSTGSTPNSLVAKLLVGTALLYERALYQLKKLPQSDFEALEPSIFAELKILPSILRALANKYIAIHWWNKEKYSDAAGYMEKAGATLASVDYTATTVQTFKPVVQHEVAEVDKLLRTYMDDLNNVFFEAATPAAQLHPVEEKTMVAPIPFELATENPVSFAERKATPNNKPATTPSSSELKAPPGTDPDVFRSLPRNIQEDVIAQYNAQNGGSTSL